MKALKAFFIIIVILAMIGGIGFTVAKNHYDTQVNSKEGNGEIVSVEIPAGSSSTDIGRLLKEKGLIEDEFIFSLYLRETGLGGGLKAGNYEFANNMSMAEIVEELTQGALAQGIRVTVLEGLRYDEVTDAIAARFADEDLSEITAASLNAIVTNPDAVAFTPEVKTFLTENKPAGKNLEGFLYPDTYEFEKSATATDVITKMLENLISKVENMPRSSSASENTFYENLILASLVEREAFPNPGEYEEVAGIFLRRVQIGELIGSDSAVLYPYKRWKPEPTAAELRADTPYNLRRNYGLPPTPIANPGQRAIAASLNAEPSEYLFFIHAPDGQVYYARTLSEQEANIQRHLR